MAGDTREATKTLATLRIKQIIAEQAARTVLLVDRSKFGQHALCKALDVGQINEVVTNSGISADELSRLERRGVMVRFETSAHWPLEETASHAT